MTFRESTDKILPNLDELHQAIQRIAFDINNRMASLQNAVESNMNDNQLRALSNLRNCVQFVASIVSSTSTTLGVKHTAQFSVTYGSEFGDCFPSEPGEAMLRWISSNTVYEFEEERAVDLTAQGRKAGSRKNLQPVDEVIESDQPDSDTDLEVEIIQALLKQGKEKLATEDFKGAERLFRNCLTRTSSSGSLVSLHHSQKSKLEIMAFLLVTYRY